MSTRAETVASVQPIQAGPEADAVKPSSARAFLPYRLRSFLREPLVHFLLLGSLLFAGYWWKGGSGPGSNRVVVTSGQVEYIAAGFARTWQRSPTPPELKGLIDNYVKDEISAREAVAMGLDKDDVIIRRHLRQRFEFLRGQSVDDAPVSDAQLQDWLDKHPGKYQGEVQLAFRQVYVNPQKYKGDAAQFARKLLAQLKAAGPPAKIGNVGDLTMLPQQQPLAPVSDIARNFGDRFAQSLMQLPINDWAGPVESPYGLHLVLVEQKAAGAEPPLDQVRPQVERDYRYARKQTQMDATYQGLMKKYSVSIEMPNTAP